MAKPQPEHKTGTCSQIGGLTPVPVPITAVARKKAGAEQTRSTTARAGRAVSAKTGKTAGGMKAAEHLSWSRRLRQNHRQPETVLLSQPSRR
jgi:hypothetical protein